MQALDDDALIHLFGFLPADSILAMRMTCKRLEAISRPRFIWQKACVDQVLARGSPFPVDSLEKMDAVRLERAVCHALRLQRFWTTPDAPPRSPYEFQVSNGTSISHARFLPGRDGRMLVTVSKGIWSEITCWDLENREPRRLAGWSPRSTLFAGFVVNADPDSSGTLATSVQVGVHRSIEILSLVPGHDGTPSFASICNIASGFKPVTLQGDLIAFSDDACETVVMNWRTNTFALLKGSDPPADVHFQYNRCLQVIFAYKSILVVRARSLELFAEPELLPSDGPYHTYRPIGYHSFGWIDGVSVNRQLDPLSPPNASAHDPLSIILRSESENPWATDLRTLEQFVLHPNLAYADDDPSTPSPYLFPPVRTDQSARSVRGFLRCPDVVLGRYGTALWIQPRAARNATLTDFDVHSSVAQGPRTRAGESLVAAVFAGALQRAEPGVDAAPRTLLVQRLDNANWTAFDYDEERGRVALASSQGEITVLDLV